MQFIYTYQKIMDFNRAYKLLCLIMFDNHIPLSKVYYSK